jgi:hypothetical protein
LFSAPLGRGHVFCAADLRAGSVQIGESKFAGSMRLSDTCSMRFNAHYVPAGRFIEIGSSDTLGCMTQYQRSWFHLLLAEAYRARVERLMQQHSIPRSTDLLASRNELAFLREYALRLLDEAKPRTMESLARVTAAIKLRVSLFAQSVATAVRSHDETAATELGYIRLQPTSDARILQGLTEATSPAPVPVVAAAPLRKPRRAPSPPTELNFNARARCTP